MNNPSTTYYESQIINKITCNNLSDTKKNVNTPIAYIEPWDSTRYIKLNPTGRWKLVNDIFEKNMLYIEHNDYLFFTTWVREDFINFYDTYPRKEVIFDCKKM